MTTYLGNRVDLLNPSPDTIDIVDIAHHLSQVNRYVGAARYPYSVAQHSFLLSHMVSEENALTALMHDATEAYLGDISYPLKALLPDYRSVEDRFWRVISEKYGLPYVMPQEVKVADTVIRYAERSALFTFVPDWGPDIEHDFMLPEVYPMSHARAEHAFRNRWLELVKPENNKKGKANESNGIEQPQLREATKLAV